MDLMHAYTAQSPEFRQSTHEANQRNLARHQQAAGARAPPPAVLQEDDPVVLRQLIQGMQQRQRDAFAFGENLIAQFFILQSELSDQQRERLTGFMSNNDEETFGVLKENDAFIARKVPGRNFRFKSKKGKGKSGNNKGSHRRGGFKPFKKSGSGGKANMANENYDPYDQAYWGKGKAKARRERKENRNSSFPLMETRLLSIL